MTAPRLVKVLLVDDVDDNRGVIRQLARRMGLELLEARALAVGMAAYVTKPIGVVDLRSLLERFLAGGAA